MKKLAIFILTFTCACSCACAFSITDWQNSIYNRIKDETIKGLKANFNLPQLSIGKASGPLVGQITFSDVNVPGMLQAKTVVVNYNLFKFIYTKDIVAAISSIKVYAAVFDINRQQNGDLNISRLMPESKPNAPPPPPFRAKIFFQSCRINYNDCLKPLSQSFDAVTGQVSFAKKDKIIIALAGQSAGSVKISGTVNLLNGNCAFDVAAEKLVFYNQAVSGSTHFFFRDNRLEFDFTKLSLRSGLFDGKCIFNFEQSTPTLHLSTRFDAFNLVSLTQNSPGIAGIVSGNLNLSGPLHTLSGQVSAASTNGSLFGQAINQLDSRFVIDRQGINFEKFSATSKTAAISAAGSISYDAFFDFAAKAHGIKLAGQGFLGPLEALVEDFEGKVSWKLDDKFLASPLKNIQARGRAKLGAGRIGEQTFRSAAGSFSLGDGLLDLEGVKFENNLTTLEAAGQVGIGHPTRLYLSAKGARLEDLKIVNYLLPEEAKNPTGQADIQLFITGELSKETKIASLDPLLSLGASGEVRLTNVLVADIPIISSNNLFTWQDRHLKLLSAALSTPRSNFALKLSFEGQPNGVLNGKVDLAEFKSLTEKYGSLDGTLGINLTFQDDLYTASFWLDQPQFNRIRLSRIDGNLTFSQGRLVLTKPLMLENGPDKYLVTGKVHFAKDYELDLNFKTANCALYPLAQLAQQIQIELSRRTSLAGSGQTIRIDPTAFVMLNPRDFLDLYHYDDQQYSYLPHWERSENRFISAEASVLPFPFGGKADLDLSLSGKTKNLSGKFTGEIKNGFLQKFIFSSLKLEGSVEGQAIAINKLTLEQPGGKLNAKCNIGFDGSAKIQAVGENLDVSHVKYDKVSLSIEKTAQWILIHNLSLGSSTLEGKIGKEIELRATLKGNAPGLLNLLSDDVRWIDGKAIGSLAINGEPGQININGQLALNNTTVFVQAINAEIKQISGEAILDNGRVKIKQVSGIWQGDSSRQAKNSLRLTGSVDLTHLLSEKGSVGLDLQLDPTYLAINLPNLFSGNIMLNAAALTGSLYFDYSQGPLLTGAAEIDNSLVTLSGNKAAGDSKKTLPLNLSLDVQINKNVYVSMGDVSSLDFSNPLMNLEVLSDELVINGQLAKPLLFGKIKISRGSVSILGREFTLLSTEQQKTYYPYDAEKIKENLAIFAGEESSLPDVSITGQVEVEDSTKDASGQIIKKNVVVLCRLQGSIGAKEQERGLKLSLNGFVRNKTSGNPEPATYNEQDLKVLLLPDFLKALTGINKDAGGGKVDTNAVLADILSSRAQSVLFRGVERELEQKLGLDSLTLEYNFGKDLKQAMGVQETRRFDNRPDWRVGFAKSFFDRLYIDVKYAQMINLTGNVNNILNYQIAYKLSPIWSIIYYREPLSMQDMSYGSNKITLLAGYSFW